MIEKALSGGGGGLLVFFLTYNFVNFQIEGARLFTLIPTEGKFHMTITSVMFLLSLRN